MKVGPFRSMQGLPGHTANFNRGMLQGLPGHTAHFNRGMLNGSGFGFNYIKAMRLAKGMHKGDGGMQGLGSSFIDPRFGSAFTDFRDTIEGAISGSAYAAVTPSAATPAAPVTPKIFGMSYATLGMAALGGLLAFKFLKKHR